MANRPTPTKLLPTAAGSPIQDVFTGGSSSFSAKVSTIWSLAKANDDNLCGCSKRGPGGLGQIRGCGKEACGLDEYYECYSILAVTTDINNKEVKVCPAWFGCIRSQFVNVGSLQLPIYDIRAWENGQYTRDPRGGGSYGPYAHRLQDGAKPVWWSGGGDPCDPKAPRGLGSTQA